MHSRSIARLAVRVADVVEAAVGPAHAVAQVHAEEARDHAADAQAHGHRLDVDLQQRETVAVVRLLVAAKNGAGQATRRGDEKGGREQGGEKASAAPREIRPRAPRRAALRFSHVALLVTDEPVLEQLRVLERVLHARGEPARCVWRRARGSGASKRPRAILCVRVFSPHKARPRARSCTAAAPTRARSTSRT